MPAWVARRDPHDGAGSPVGGGRSDDGSGPQPSSTPAQKPAERVVIYRLGSLGDTIVALPCFHKIAKTFPEAERYVLTNVPVSSKAAPLESILANSGLVDGVISYPVGLRSITKLAGLAWRLRNFGASTLIYLAAPRGSAATYRDLIFFSLCGFNRIIGAPVSRDFRECRVEETTGYLEQECIRLARTIGALGPVDLESRANWDLRLTDQEKAVGAKTFAAFDGRPVIAINMGGKEVRNHWGEENWRRFFAELAKTHGDYGLLVVGAADDASSAASVTANWPSPVVNACGRLSPRESAAALENACLFVGHDSGPMHLAASRGISCVALFSGVNPPRRWHPYGARHKVLHRMEGIDLIGVDEVLGAVREALPARIMEKKRS